MIFFLGFLFFYKDFFCFSVWGSFPCYLLHFGAKIFDLHAVCYILELKSLICMLFAAFWTKNLQFCMLFAAFRS